MAWWFYFSKFIDFADSIFFVLRKKTNQLSTLHIIHHSTMPIFSWFGPKVGITSQYCYGYYSKCVAMLQFFSLYNPFVKREFVLIASGSGKSRILYWDVYFFLIFL
jgi:elongation of very long chain fatty acids protein 7